MLIDLVGIRSAARQSLASGQMRDLHRTVVREIQTGNYSFAQVYAYNDAVLLLSYIDAREESLVKAMRDSDALKKRIDRIQKSYAIAVKGQTFPIIQQVSIGQKVTVIEASSWAMANCFEIEKKLGALRRSWYIDNRIAKKILLSKACLKRRVRMYPSGRERVVYAFDGYLWNDT